MTQVRHGQRTDLGTQRMFAVPSNVGPLTMPNYEALAAQGIYSLANGGRYMMGCCSLNSQDPEMGHAVFASLKDCFTCRM